MDKFRVGQKVRLIKAAARKDLLGGIFTVIAPKELRKTLQGLVYAYVIDAKPNKGFKDVGALEEWLEPVYDGDEKSSWSECIWNPHKVKA